MLSPHKIAKRSRQRFLHHLKNGDNPAIISYSDSGPLILEIKADGDALVTKPIGTIFI